eukprot:m.42692 g.42692  ORF g.42692 m.42692 type:complete len:368 (+) comp9902_c0_seq1:111-1214(+)
MMASTTPTAMAPGKGTSFAGVHALVKGVSSGQESSSRDSLGIGAMSLTGPRTPMMSSLIPPRTLSLNAVNEALEVWLKYWEMFPETNIDIQAEESLSISSFHLPEEEANLADSDSDVNMSHQFTSAGSKASKDVGRRIGNSQHRMRTHLMGFPLYFVSRVLEGTILENQTDIHTIIASYYVTPCQRKAEQEAARPENMASLLRDVALYAHQLLADRFAVLLSLGSIPSDELTRFLAEEKITIGERAQRVIAEGISKQIMLGGPHVRLGTFLREIQFEAPDESWEMIIECLAVKITERAAAVALTGSVQLRAEEASSLPCILFADAWAHTRLADVNRALVRRGFSVSVGQRKEQSIGLGFLYRYNVFW